VVTSALPRPLTAPSDDVLISALPRPLILVGPPSRDDQLTSALFDTHSVLTDLAYSDYTVQRSSENVSFLDRTNTVMSQRTDPLLAGSATRINTASSQWLTEFPPPPPVHRQVPLLSDNIQTTASAYVNTDPVPVLTAHRYANIPVDSNYQGISAGLSLPTHINVPTHANVPLSQAIAFEQPGFSAFSRVDVHHSRPAVADSTVQYAVCTLLPSATADHVRPTITAQTAPLQSPSVHSRQRFAYDYVQPDTGLGAPTHAAPAIHSGYIRPQTSDTHTHTFKLCALAKRVIWRKSYNDWCWAAAAPTATQFLRTTWS